MEGTCPVVTVKTEGGTVRINKSDYDADPGAYVLVDGAEATPTPPVVASAAPQFFIQKEGRKFFIYDLTGSKAGDTDGYTTEAKAKEAIDALKG